jgi:Spy/CpxP family protein refolding chaperone
MMKTTLSRLAMAAAFVGILSTFGCSHPPQAGAAQPQTPPAAQAVKASPLIRFEQAGAVMAGDPSVQKELKLTAAQQQQLLKFIQEYGVGQQRVYNAWGADDSDAAVEKYQAELDRLSDVLANRVLGVLTPEQRTRVRQIGLQLVGIGAFQDEGLATELNLSPEQRERIGGILKALEARSEEFDAKLGARLEALGEPKSEAQALDFERKRMAILKEMDAERQALEREVAAAEAQVTAVLSPEQKARWEQLRGTPFKFGRAEDAG